jgi:hypothetical protein
VLGERATTEITRVKDSMGFPELKKDAHEGGDIDGNARIAIEDKTKRPVVSKDNYLPKKKINLKVISRP